MKMQDQIVIPTRLPLPPGEIGQLQEKLKLSKENLVELSGRDESQVAETFSTSALSCMFRTTQFIYQYLEVNSLWMALAVYATSADAYATASQFPILAQAGIQSRVDHFVTEFLAPILMLVGVTMITYGGWQIHRGETGQGLLAIIGGFIVASAIPMMRLIMQF